MGTIKRKVHGQFLRFSSRYQHRERFFLLPAILKGDTTKLFDRFLQLKVQAPELSDEQAITQVIKALRAG
jgi:hypothetical protein